MRRSPHSHERVNINMKSKLWVRLICLILCLAVLLPSVSALAETTKVATYMLRLREKPSTSSKVLDAYPRGTKVTILKKGEEWTKVKVGGKTGYMQSSKLAYAKYKTNAEREAIVSNKSTTKKTGVTSGETAYIMKGVKLNLRAEANNTSDIIASFRGGTKVTVIKKGRHWSLVEVKGLEGYMSTDYLTSEKE